MAYGDYDNVTKDAKAIYDIQSRQGNSLILECVAETLGKTCSKFNMTEKERMRVVGQLLGEFKELMLERV